MAYDSTDRSVVLFGGLTTTSQVVNTTWIYKSGHWSQLNVSKAPSPRWGFEIANDPSSGGVILFGGQFWTGSKMICFNDTWKFSNLSWTQLHPHGSPQKKYSCPYPGSMVYYPAKQELVLYGGGNSSLMWAFKNGNWSYLHYSVANGRGLPAASLGWMTWDALDRYVLWFGPGGYNTTLSFSAGVWTNLAPRPAPPGSPSGDTPVAYDPVLGTSVMFVGGFWNFTWKFSGGSWTNATFSPSPPAGAKALLTYDGADRCILLYESKQTWKFS